MKTFSVSMNGPINIYEDNSGAIEIAKYGSFTKNSKHVEIHYHYVNECVKAKLINIIKVDSEENIADILTEALCREKFGKFRDLMNVK